MFAAFTDLTIDRNGAFILLWLTMLGGIIGSFLNVVVYRLPAGKSLLFPGSQCPQCHHAIRCYNNLPVLGWFLLGGKCRDCQAPIGARYPAVEALTAIIFLTVALTHVVLPLPDHTTDVDRYWLVLKTEFGRFLYLVTLLCGLEVAALIRYDGHRLPRSLVWFLVLLGFIAPLLWPNVRASGDRADLGMSLMLGAAVGVAAAMFVTLAVRWLDKSSGVAIEVGTVLVSVGIFLGTRMVANVALVATVIFLLAALVSRRRLPWIVYASVFTCLAVALGFSL